MEQIHIFSYKVNYNEHNIVIHVTLKKRERKPAGAGFELTDSWVVSC